MSEWADANRVLSPESSAEPGRWSTDRAAYLRGLMDAGQEPGIHTVVGMICSQVGKTEAENNIIGYHVDHDPCPMLAIYPTVERGQDWSKERLAPMLRDTPALRSKVKPARARDSENTIVHKAFPGGHLSVVGANSPAGLAARPIRIVVADEVDRFPVSAGSEGDPIALGKQRQATFWNRLLYLIGSPTIKGESRIEHAHGLSDKRVFLVDCHACGHSQVLRWSQVIWPPDQPELAQYECEACAAMWNDGQRNQAVRGGRWQATAPFTGTAGFHLNAIYSPWTLLGELAQEFLEAKKLPDTLQVFTNTKLAETWEYVGEGVESTLLLDRREQYDSTTVPDGVLVIVAGVDVQDDRLEIEVMGVGLDMESWSIEYRVIYGDPGQSELWTDLADFLDTRYEVAGGQLKIAAAAIDSGGHFTDEVYKFTKGKSRRRWWAIKGMPGPGRAIWPAQPARNNRHRAPRFDIGVDTIKETLFQRLNIETPGPGFCHFPDDYEQAYFDGLTSETVVTKWFKGRPRREWVIRRSRQRNEPLDCRVYAMAALTGLNPNLPKIHRRRARRRERTMDERFPEPRAATPEPREAKEPAEAAEDTQAADDMVKPKKKPKRKRRRGGWVRGGVRGGWVSGK